MGNTGVHVPLPSLFIPNLQLQSYPPIKFLQIPLQGYESRNSGFSCRRAHSSISTNFGHLVNAINWRNKTNKIVAKRMTIVEEVI
jgi:hypothetical protein